MRRVKSRGAIGSALNPQPSTLNPSGATLSEILISLMVMSIGVVSLATLFPISVLRSIQASQLTNATIHRLNVEQLIGLFPRLVHDPNANGNLAQHELQVGSGGLDNPVNTNDGINEGRFIVDPVGETHTSFSAAVRVVFGNDAGAAPATFPINRYNGFAANGALSVADAQKYGYLADSWQLAAKGNVASTPDGLSITVPPGIDLATSNAALTATNPVRVRVVLISQNGRQSITRDSVLNGLTINVGTNTISWTDAIPVVAPFAIDTDADGIPDTLTFSRFRLETYDPRYSWLLTVRKTPSVASPGQGTANVDVVVFHKRSFSAAAEQVFTVQSWSGTECTLNLSGAPAGTKPFLKKGGFLFDAQHAHWYRIAKIVEHPTNPVISLDRSVIAPVNNAGVTIPPARVMALPGIVEVYPIGSVSFNANNAP